MVFEYSKEPPHGVLFLFVHAYVERKAPFGEMHGPVFPTQGGRGGLMHALRYLPLDTVLTCSGRIVQLPTYIVVFCKQVFAGVHLGTLGVSTHGQYLGLQESNQSAGLTRPCRSRPSDWPSISKARNLTLALLDPRGVSMNQFVSQTSLPPCDVKPLPVFDTTSTLISFKARTNIRKNTCGTSWFALDKTSFSVARQLLLPGHTLMPKKPKGPTLVQP